MRASSAMSEQNVEIVRRWVEFYNRRDTAGLIQLTTSDYEIGFREESFTDRSAALEAVGLEE